MVARWCEVGGGASSRLWGVWTFFPMCIRKPLRFLKLGVIAVGSCYESGCCRRLDLQGRGGQNGREGDRQVAFAVVR